MTIIVGIRCTDGVVIGADSSATSLILPNFPSTEDHTHKIDIVNNELIIASSGLLGIQQRLSFLCESILQDSDIRSMSKIEVGKTFRNKIIEEFNSTNLAPNNYSSMLLAHESIEQPVLFEISPVNTQMQPEWKELNQLWYAAIGSGQNHADPFLAFLRSVYLRDWNEAPDLKLGKFMVYWTLRHVCNVNPGGVKEPVYLATLSYSIDRFRARMLTDDEISELSELLDDATGMMYGYLHEMVYQ